MNATASKKINVGVSISATAGSNIWDSGLNQNIAFLVILLRQIPEVGDVYLLNGGDLAQLPASMAFEGLGAPLVNPAQVTHDIDLVIEAGASLPLEWLRHVRALGKHIVTMYVGHTYTGQAENPIFGRSGGSAFIGTPWHEIWTLPQHMKTSGPMLRTLSRVPVHEVRHIWSPLFLQTQIDLSQRNGHSFGFQPKKSGWRIAIFEPNISVVKCSFIPMLLCDQAYREKREAVDLMMVMNTFHMKDHPTFNRLALNLDLTRDSKASYEPRLSFVDCMAQQKMDAVVAHQWECGLNYAYYDTLYGGYPLIHNSEFLQAADMGFYYPGFEAIQGAKALLSAWEQEPGYWDKYRGRAAVYLQKLAPQHPANVQFYRDRILSVVGGRHE